MVGEGVLMPLNQILNAARPYFALRSAIRFQLVLGLLVKIVLKHTDLLVHSPITVDCKPLRHHIYVESCPRICWDA